MIEMRDNQSTSVEELATALSRAQAKIKGAIKDAKNPFFKSNYATLESIWEAIREPFTSEGLSVVQSTEPIDGRDYVRTVLFHSSGQYVDGLFPIVLGEKKDAQAMGSSVSYSRRYALMGMCGVCPHDDDGESAVNHNHVSKPQIVVPKQTKLPPLTNQPQDFYHGPTIPNEAKEFLDRLNRDKDPKDMTPFELIDEPPLLKSEYPIAAVREHKASPEPAICCGKKMNQSKYNENELYCFTCKSKRQKNW